MNIYLILPIIAGILLGLTESINKSMIEKKYSVFAYSFLQWAGNLFFYLILFFIYKESFPIDFRAYIPLFTVITIVFIGNLLIIKAYKFEDVSNINIVLRISLVVSFINGILLLSEKVSTLNYLGVILIILGIIAIFYKGKKIAISTGLIYTLFGGICFGMMAYLNKLALAYFTPVAFLVGANIGGSLISLAIPQSRKDIIPILKKHSRKYLLSRLASFSSSFLFIIALSKSNISIVNTNYETFSLLSVVFIGIVFLNEKTNIRNKKMGSLLCILGIILLNFF